MSDPIPLEQAFLIGARRLRDRTLDLTEYVHPRTLGRRVRRALRDAKSGTEYQTIVDHVVGRFGEEFFERYCAEPGDE